MALLALLCVMPPASAQCPETPGQAVVDLVNAERAKEGLAPYRVSLRLHEAALGHARDLASGPESGHAGSDGSDPSMRADRVGYRWSWIGENVAAGQRSPAEVVAGWMASPPHRHNVLDPRFEEVGVGYVSKDASRFVTYWVMVFGARQVADDGWVPCNP